MESLFRFDSIRISKLLEVSQYAIIASLIGLLFGGLLNKIFPKYDEDKPIYHLLLEISLQMIAIVISIYYITKFVNNIPFLFHYDKNYIPSKKGEAARGVTIGLSIIFIGSQYFFMNKLEKTGERIFA